MQLSAHESRLHFQAISALRTASIDCARYMLLYIQMSGAENDLMADLEAGLSAPGTLASTNGRPMEDSAMAKQVIVKAN